MSGFPISVSMPTAFQPVDPDYESRVRASFARQAAMRTLGVTIDRVAPGSVDLALPFRADLSQQHGFLHAGVATAAMDSACGYAALSLMAPGTGVLSVEFKVQLLAPARGVKFRASGRVVRAGRTLMVVAGQLVAFADVASEQEGGEGEVVALLSGTMMTIRDRPGVTD